MNSNDFVVNSNFVEMYETFFVYVKFKCDKTKDKTIKFRIVDKFYFITGLLPVLFILGFDQMRTSSYGIIFHKNRVRRLK